MQMDKELIGFDWTKYWHFWWWKCHSTGGQWYYCWKDQPCYLLWLKSHVKPSTQNLYDRMVLQVWHTHGWWHYLPSSHKEQVAMLGLGLVFHNFSVTTKSSQCYDDSSKIIVKDTFHRRQAPLTQLQQQISIMLELFSTSVIGTIKSIEHAHICS